MNNKISQKTQTTYIYQSEDAKSHAKFAPAVKLDYSHLINTTVELGSDKLKILWHL